MTTSIDSSYYLQDTIYNPYKKAGDTLEKKDCDTSIWQKDTNNDSTTTATTKQTVNPRRVVDEIHDSCGLFCDSENLKKFTEKINVDNVISVVNMYKNTYGKSIFKAIMRNVFLSSEVRANAVKHIKDMYMQAMKQAGVYADDIDKSIDGHIEYEKNKFGRMNSKLIDRDMRYLTDRCKQTRQGKNTLYQANGKIDEEFNQGNYILDCWLIAAVKSLSINTKGQEMLDNIMSIDDKGNVTVKLKGVGREYTISKEELEGANELAQGDLDVRAIEIATRRYLQETGDHANIFKKIKSRFSGAHIHLSDYNMYNGMHNLSTPYYILFGKSLDYDTPPNKKTIEQIKSGNYSTVVTSYNSYCVDGFDKCHVYAVTKADEKYVYLSNPYGSVYKYVLGQKIPKKDKMTHNEFLKFFYSYSMRFPD